MFSKESDALHDQEKIQTNHIQLTASAGDTKDSSLSKPSDSSRADPKPYCLSYFCDLLPILSTYYSKNNKSHGQTPDGAAEAIDALNKEIVLPSDQRKNLVESTISEAKKEIQKDM